MQDVAHHLADAAALHQRKSESSKTPSQEKNVLTLVLAVLGADPQRLVVQELLPEQFERFEVAADLLSVLEIVRHQVEEEVLIKVDPKLGFRKDRNLPVLIEDEEGAAPGEALVQVQEKLDEVAEVLIVVKMRILVTNVLVGKESEVVPRVLEITFVDLTLQVSDQNFQAPLQTLLSVIRLVWQIQRSVTLNWSHRHTDKSFMEIMAIESKLCKVIDSHHSRLVRQRG